jgi:hypothetical protein
VRGGFGFEEEDGWHGGEELEVVLVGVKKAGG